MKKKKIKDSSECVIPTFYVFFCPQGPNIFIPKKSHNDIAFQFRKSRPLKFLDDEQPGRGWKCRIRKLSHEVK